MIGYKKKSQDGHFNIQNYSAHMCHIRLITFL